MNAHDEERTAQLLAQAFTEEAALADPSPGGLQAIQRRTGEASGSSRRPWMLGALGAGLATAAVITTVVLVGHDGGTQRAPAVDKPSGGTVQQSAMHKGVYNPNAPAGSQVTVYYVGQVSSDAPSGRLYAETHTVQPTSQSPDVAAAHEFLTSTPIDPDYSSGWPDGVDVAGITDRGNVTSIALTGSADLGTQPGNVNLPTDPAMAIQALLATARVHGPATFTYNGKPAHWLRWLLYQDVVPSVTLKSDYEVRALISIDNIVDGQTMSNPVTVLVSGNTFEGNVIWQLFGADGKKLAGGTTITSMGMWTQVPVHLGRLDPGTYTFKVLENSPKNGTPINVDDKAFTVG